jgi:undecaprenyl-diphosphatase
MDILLMWKALVMAVVEGITEFLPISSTGHLILTGSLIGFHDDKAKLFDVVIQAGAILAVCWEYRRRLLLLTLGLPKNRSAQLLALNIIIAFLPLAVLGVLFHEQIKHYLFAPVPVASAFIVGGILILWVEQRYQRFGEASKVRQVDDLGWRDALKVGLIQALALIPGTSRAGASIIGGMALGLSRKTATEFSFFVGIPTLLGAAVYDLYKERHLLTMADLPHLSVGFVGAFISAFLCMRWLLRFVERHTFNGFAWYRIAFGALILVTDYSGLVNWYPT